MRGGYRERGIEGKSDRGREKGTEKDRERERDREKGKEIERGEVVRKKWN